MGYQKQQECYCNISSVRKISGQATSCIMDVAFHIIQMFAPWRSQFEYQCSHLILGMLKVYLTNMQISVSFHEVQDKHIGRLNTDCLKQLIRKWEKCLESTRMRGCKTPLISGANRRCGKVVSFTLWLLKPAERSLSGRINEDVCLNKSYLRCSFLFLSGLWSKCVWLFSPQICLLHFSLFHMILFDMYI